MASEGHQFTINVGDTVNILWEVTLSHRRKGYKWYQGTVSSITETNRTNITVTVKYDSGEIQAHVLVITQYGYDWKAGDTWHIIRNNQDSASNDDEDNDYKKDDEDDVIIIDDDDEDK
jgi:hypothetical protein